MYIRTVMGGICLLCLFLVSCSQQNVEGNSKKQYKDITGYVMSVDQSHILVIEKVDVEEKPFPNAAVYKLTDDTIIESIEGEKHLETILSVGTLVEVYHTGSVAESFPTQASAAKIVVHTEGEAKEMAKAISAAVQTLDSASTWWVTSVLKSSTHYEIQFSKLMFELDPIVVRIDKEFHVIE